MTRTAWQFDGYAWPTNPDEDSGWVTEPMYAEKNPLAASVSKFQFTALKSARRQVSGYLYGVHALEQRDKMDEWLRKRVQATLVDHLGGARRAVLLRFEARAVPDVRAHRDGRATFRFAAEFVALE